MNEKHNIDIINIKPEKVLKQFKNLNVSKSRGPDNYHHFYLRECAKEFISQYLRYFRDPYLLEMYQ